MRLTETEKKEIYTMYQSGKYYLKEIAERIGCSVKTVKNAIDKKENNGSQRCIQKLIKGQYVLIFNHNTIKGAYYPYMIHIYDHSTKWHNCIWYEPKKEMMTEKELINFFEDFIKYWRSKNGQRITTV